MQTIVSMTDILIRTTMTTCQNDAVQVILESITLMKQLANDVLDISKIEAGKLTLENVSFDLRQCIRTGVHGFVHMATTKKLDFQQQLASDLPVRILSDPTRFHQILLNLLSNAFKVRHAFLICCVLLSWRLALWQFTARGSVIVKVQVEEGTLKEKPKEDEKADEPKAQESKEKEQKPAKTKDTLIVLRIEVSDTGIGQ
jgi:signal transduction histidine kinase